MKKVKATLYGDNYFVPNKRYALDGKAWWCVLVVPKNDRAKMRWSTYTCHGKYRTMADC